MNTSIDFRILPINVPSLCIPRVFKNWTKSRICRVFDDLSLGEILHIDIVSNSTEKGEKFNQVIIHFKRWFESFNADTARERLMNGKDVKIIYDDPWFWKIFAYRVESFSVTRNHPLPSIQFDNSRDIEDRRPPHQDRRPHQYIRPQRPNIKVEEGEVEYSE